jgi:hypothetical protein
MKAASVPSARAPGFEPNLRRLDASQAEKGRPDAVWCPPPGVLPWNVANQPVGGDERLLTYRAEGNGPVLPIGTGVLLQTPSPPKYGTQVLWTDTDLPGLNLFAQASNGLGYGGGAGAAYLRLERIRVVQQQDVEALAAALPPLQSGLNEVPAPVPWGGSRSGLSRSMFRASGLPRFRADCARAAGRLPGKGEAAPSPCPPLLLVRAQRTRQSTREVCEQESVGLGPDRCPLHARQGLDAAERLFSDLGEESGAQARGRYGDLFGIGVLAAVQDEDAAAAVTFMESGRAGALLDNLDSGEAFRPISSCSRHAIPREVRW